MVGFWIILSEYRVTPSAGKWAVAGASGCSPAPAMPGCIAPMPAIGFMRLGTIAGATAGC